MKIVFRVDASGTIGTGHLMRCSALGVQLRAKDHQVFFICREHASFPLETLGKYGFSVIKLPRSPDEAIGGGGYLSWLGVALSQDKTETLVELEKIGEVDYLVVDHYALNAEWETPMRACVKKILVIDDLANRQHDADILLDQNYYLQKNRYQKFIPGSCKELLGPSYALLRREFAQLHRKAKIRTNIQRILVNFGGVDLHNVTMLTVQALLLSKFVGNVDVVVGQPNPHQKIVEAFCHQAGFNYFCQTPDMAELMLKADLAIGAGGSTSWERCCLGLPALIFSIAENQEQLALDLEHYGAAYYLGNPRGLTVEKISQIFQRNIDLPSMSELGLSLVDGLGVDRVIAAMELYGN